MDLSVADHCRRPAVDSDAYKESPSVGKDGHEAIYDFLYLWIAIAYYAICCDERSYNGALAMFWVVMATIWVWDAITGYTTFERTYKYDILSYVLLILPFVYPLVSIARGLTFQALHRR